MPIARKSANSRTLRYQEGSLVRVTRATGPDVWVFRWREDDGAGKRVQRKRVIGTVDDLKTLSDAKRASDNLRLAANTPIEPVVDKVTFGRAWGHFQVNELNDKDVARSPTTVKGYEDYLKRHILPTWRDVDLNDIKAVPVERWLRGLHLSNGSKTKIRNYMSSIFSHAIRHELYLKINPMSSVRQSSKREKEPEILNLEELRLLIAKIENDPARLMVAVAATTALRRSEFSGLKWSDLDLDARWINLRRGVVHNMITNLKTAASRKGVPMVDDLADLLGEWRTKTLYPGPDDWVFASPARRGRWPLAACTVMRFYVQPAARAAGIKKTITWHMFRHSVGSLLGQSGEQIKTVQEILRHANSRITQDVYMQADQGAKRNALQFFSGLQLMGGSKLD